VKLNRKWNWKRKKKRYERLNMRILLYVLILLIGCKEGSREIKRTSDVPEWFLEVSAAKESKKGDSRETDKIYSVSMATSPDLMVAKQKAYTAAKIEISRQIAEYVSTEIERTVEDTTGGSISDSKDTSNRFSTKTLEQSNLLSETLLEACKIDRTAIYLGPRNEYRFFYRLSIRKSDASNILREARGVRENEENIGNMKGSEK
jgi:hypothetical protein